MRGDRLHPIVSGNKWFKLKPLLEQARRQRRHTLVSVGGAFSNHLHALAFAGRALDFATVGIIRGPEPAQWSPTLRDCRDWGMTLHFVDREHYRERYRADFADFWCARYPRSCFVPEGGWSSEAIAASSAWWRLIGTDLDHVVCPVGSGTTLAALALSAPDGTRVIGVPVYRDPDAYESLRRKLEEQGLAPTQYELWPGWAGRGFGRSTERERTFAAEFEQREGVPLDPVYTAKTFYAVAERLIRQPGWRRYRIGVLHTGGLQGRRGVGGR